MKTDLFSLQFKKVFELITQVKIGSTLTAPMSQNAVPTKLPAYVTKYCAHQASCLCYSYVTKSWEYFVKISNEGSTSKT